MSRARAKRQRARGTGAGRGRRSAASPHVSVLVEAPEWPRRLRAAAALARRAGREALSAAPAGGSLGTGTVELNVVLADDRAVRRLNRDWRGQDKATNVLSFPSQNGPARNGPARNGRPVPRLPPGVPVLLGDVVVACGVAATEAAAQGKTLRAHLAHLVVHGVLHLLGHDHELDAEAERMEALEAKILRRMGIANPYRTTA